jgi:regulatory protein
VARHVDLGFVDDLAYARAKSGGLLRRGYGQRSVSQALGEAGIAEHVQAEVSAGEGARRRAALALARKRRFGPFGPDLPERDKREKQLAAMLRAGHPLDFAREMINARSIEAAEEWAASIDDEEDERL